MAAAALYVDTSLLDVRGGAGGGASAGAVEVRATGGGTRALGTRRSSERTRGTGGRDYRAGISVHADRRAGDQHGNGVGAAGLRGSGGTSSGRDRAVRVCAASGDVASGLRFRRRSGAAVWRGVYGGRTRDVSAVSPGAGGLSGDASGRGKADGAGSAAERRVDCGDGARAGHGGAAEASSRRTALFEGSDGRVFGDLGVPEERRLGGAENCARG